MDKPEPKLKAFDTPEKWRVWLEKNYEKQEGILIKFYKKASGIKTITYAEALDEALCFGWIDGQSKSIDDICYQQKFTPRRARSMWSKINIGNVERLIKAGKMTETGLKEIERAKADGRWDQAYDSPSSSTVPDDFLKELKKDKKAYEFFETLSKTNKYAITFRLQTAKKPETRERRMKQILDMLKKGEKFH